jgi:hypothetical protein
VPEREGSVMDRTSRREGEGNNILYIHARPSTVVITRSNGSAENPRPSSLQVRIRLSLGPEPMFGLGLLY